MNPIKERIIRCLNGQGDSPVDIFMAVSAESQNEFIPIGIKNNADALLIARRANETIYLFGLVGRSLVQGDDLHRFVEAYFADEGGLELHAPKIADYLYKDIQRTSTAVMFLASKDQRFRSFRPLKNIDEVLTGSLNG
jgi:hypothetical protein